MSVHIIIMIYYYVYANPYLLYIYTLIITIYSWSNHLDGLVYRASFPIRLLFAGRCVVSVVYNIRHMLFVYTNHIYSILMYSMPLALLYTWFICMYACVCNRAAASVTIIRQETSSSSFLVGYQRLEGTVIGALVAFAMIEVYTPYNTCLYTIYTGRFCVYTYTNIRKLLLCSSCNARIQLEQSYTVAIMSKSLS